MSYLPSFLSTSIRWSKVSEKYWNSAFCLCTSSPKMRLRNLVMEQSGGWAGGPQATSSPPTPFPAHLEGEGDSPFSTSRQPDLDSRPPMPTDSRPCFMSAGRGGLSHLHLAPAHPRFLCH